MLFRKKPLLEGGVVLGEAGFKASEREGADPVAPELEAPGPEELAPELLDVVRSEEVAAAGEELEAEVPEPGAALPVLAPDVGAPGFAAVTDAEASLVGTAESGATELEALGRSAEPELGDEAVSLEVPVEMEVLACRALRRDVSAKVEVPGAEGPPAPTDPAEVGLPGEPDVGVPAPGAPKEPELSGPLGRAELATPAELSAVTTEVTMDVELPGADAATDERPADADAANEVRESEPGLEGTLPSGAPSELTVRIEVSVERGGLPGAEVGLLVPLPGAEVAVPLPGMPGADVMTVTNESDPEPENPLEGRGGMTAPDDAGSLAPGSVVVRAVVGFGLAGAPGAVAGPLMVVYDGSRTPGVPDDTGGGSME